MAIVPGRYLVVALPDRVSLRRLSRPSCQSLRAEQTSQQGSVEMTYADMFQRAMPGSDRAESIAPYPCQAVFATAEQMPTVLNLPTGAGKTAMVVLGWLYRRRFHGVRPAFQPDHLWPIRPVWCLPMRVLVEQTAERCRAMINRWADEAGVSEDYRPHVHVLMGGEDTGRWWLEPERHAVFVGTQDMLLSRALNRGYASGRARWPMEYALLNQDCLWVMDEVQLMDVSLATSAQLQAFRDQDRSKQLRPYFTWWMSATLQPDWLKSVDTEPRFDAWTRDPCVVPADQRAGGLFDVSKSVQTEAIAARDVPAFAQRILEEHETLADLDHGHITLVVCNTVQRALDTHAALRKAGRSDGLELAHSRFRPSERAAWRERFLNRDACTAGADRIIVATQVVEAGVDISASCLVTELAPWPSLVQRFGRCARYGGSGRIVVIDRGQDDKAAAPYQTEELTSAWDALQSLPDAGLAALEAFEEHLDDAGRRRLYPYDPSHLLMRDEFDELFDTTPDLTGADLDISRFIRSGDERDLQVFWDDIPRDEQPAAPRRPRREELCAVPFLAVRDWLCGAETKSSRKPRLRKNMRAWIWDWIDGQWVTAEREMLLPGRVVLVDARSGGYVPDTGFAPNSHDPVVLVPMPSPDPIDEQLEQSDNQQDGEPLSISEWKTIATHSSEVESAVTDIAAALGLSDDGDLTRILKLAARWHDIGKAHPAFQGKIRDAGDDPRPDRNDLAKGPDSAWLKPPGLYVFRGDETEKRPAFRHELASALALFSALRQYAPEHPALLGPWKDLLDQFGIPFPEKTANAPPTPEVEAVLDCDATQFNLLAYLIAAHHGKVRVALHAAPADQNYQPQPDDNQGLPIRGVRNGDILRSISLTPNRPPLPALPLTLTPAELGLSFETGASWHERTQTLLTHFSPPTLALLEAILRAADIRASQLKTEDPVLELECVQ